MLLNEKLMMTMPTNPKISNIHINGIANFLTSLLNMIKTSLPHKELQLKLIIIFQTEKIIA